MESKMDLNCNKLIKENGRTKENRFVIKGYQHLF